MAWGPGPASLPFRMEGSPHVGGKGLHVHVRLQVNWLQHQQKQAKCTRITARVHILLNKCVGLNQRKRGNKVKPLKKRIKLLIRTTFSPAMLIC